MSKHANISNMLHVFSCNIEMKLAQSQLTIYGSVACAALTWCSQGSHAPFRKQDSGIGERIFPLAEGHTRLESDAERNTGSD